MDLIKTATALAVSTSIENRLKSVFGSVFVDAAKGKVMEKKKRVRQQDAARQQVARNKKRLALMVPAAAVGSVTAVAATVGALPPGSDMIIGPLRRAATAIEVEKLRGEVVAASAVIEKLRRDVVTAEARATAAEAANLATLGELQDVPGGAGYSGDRGWDEGAAGGAVEMEH